MSEVKTSATATIVQAAEQVVIEEASVVAKQLASKNAGDIKTIVNGVAQQTVAASDDSVPTIIQNVEDGAKVVGNEVVKGAEAVVDAVEKHPELLAEGAVALGVGVASLVAPELIVGSVALVGKMAADATKETINNIVVESGDSVVKGIAKEVTKDTAELAAQDAAEKAKTAALETAKDGSKPGVEATVAVESSGSVQSAITTTDSSKADEAGKKVETTVAGDATAIVREVTLGDTPGPIIASKTVQTSATAMTETKGDAHSVTTSGPSVVLTTNDLTGDQKAAVQQGSTTAVVGNSKEPAPVSVASVDVKVLAKEVAREMSELETPKSGQAGEKTLESAIPTKSGSDKLLQSAAARLEADIEESAARNEADVSANLRLRLTKLRSAQSQDQDTLGTVQATPTATEAKKAESVKEEPPILLQLGLVHPENPGSRYPAAPETAPPENKQAEKGSGTATTVEVEHIKASEAPPTELSKPMEVSETAIIPEGDSEEAVSPPDAQEFEEAQIANPPPADEQDMETEPLVASIKTNSIPPKDHEHDATTQDNQDIPQTPQSALRSNEAAHAATQAAVQEAHVKIASLHTSNELLHQKLDTMQEALLAITKALSERPYVTPSSAPETEPTATTNSQLVLASAVPAIVNKRMSVFGSIGWLFGAGSGATKHKKGKSVATSTPASVPSGGSVS